MKLLWQTGPGQAAKWRVAGVDVKVPLSVLKLLELGSLVVRVRYHGNGSWKVR